MKPPLNLTIGTLSTEAGVATETIHYDERIGILPKPARTAGGHRLFTEEHKQRLIFIRRARELGFSLDQVRALLGLTGGRRLTCAKVKGITEQHIADIRQRVKDLKRLERGLTDMVAHGPGGENPDCPILDALATGERLPDPPSWVSPQQGRRARP